MKAFNRQTHMEQVQCGQKNVDAEASIWTFHDGNTALYLLREVRH